MQIKVAPQENSGGLSNAPNHAQDVMISHSSDKSGPGCWFLLLLVCLLLWSELHYVSSHRQNKCLCLPFSCNWAIMEAELLSSLCKLTQIVSSIHFCQVLPCSLGRNCHCKQSPILQKRHIWLEIEFCTRRPGWSPERKSMHRVKFIFLSWNCNSVIWIPLGKDFSFPSFPAKILSLCPS